MTSKPLPPIKRLSFLRVGLADENTKQLAVFRLNELNDSYSRPYGEQAERHAPKDIEERSKHFTVPKERERFERKA